MQLKAAYQPYMMYSAAERMTADSTRAKYRDCFEAWLLPTLGSIELEDLARTDLLELRRRMSLKGLSVYRQYNVLICLKTFLSFVRSVLKAKTLDPREITLPSRGNPHVAYLTKSEVAQILDAIDTHTYTGSRLRALTELLLATGMRISEALSLNRAVFDADAPETEIVGKGRRIREVFFSDRCRLWVKRYLDRRHDDHEALFVTTGYPARRLQVVDISRFYISLRAKARLDKRLTPHILRHTFCTQLLFNGADIAHIKELAGHQSIQTTAKYYLGRDKRVLKDVLRRHLDYDPAAESERLAA